VTDYRYILHRGWIGSGDANVVWIMLNPSTATDTQDDPTIRKCVGFTSRWGYSGLIVLNLYAARATDPKQLWEMDDPVGPQNDRQLHDALVTAAAREWPVICAWGANARDDRVAEVAGVLFAEVREPLCLGVTLRGQPRHPLYVPYTARATPWPKPPASAVTAAELVDDDVVTLTNLDGRGQKVFTVETAKPGAEGFVDLTLVHVCADGRLGARSQRSLPDDTPVVVSR
jgi:hypothetical protein